MENTIATTDENKADALGN